jgi:hypothetical protein
MVWLYNKFLSVKKGAKKPFEPFWHPGTEGVKGKEFAKPWGDGVMNIKY